MLNVSISFGVGLHFSRLYVRAATSRGRLSKCLRSLIVYCDWVIRGEVKRETSFLGTLANFGVIGFYCGVVLINCRENCKVHGIHLCKIFNQGIRGLKCPTWLPRTTSASRSESTKRCRTRGATLAPGFPRIYLRFHFYICPRIWVNNFLYFETSNSAYKLADYLKKKYLCFMYYGWLLLYSR